MHHLHGYTSADRNASNEVIGKDYSLWYKVIALIVLIENIEFKDWDVSTLRDRRLGVCLNLI